MAKLAGTHRGAVAIVVDATARIGQVVIQAQQRQLHDSCSAADVDGPAGGFPVCRSVAPGDIEPQQGQVSRDDLERPLQTIGVNDRALTGGDEQDQGVVPDVQIPCVGVVFGCTIQRKLKNLSGLERNRVGSGKRIRLDNRCAQGTRAGASLRQHAAKTIAGYQVDQIGF
ncbi:MAG: hypothetical protein BWZ07_02944 [Alphaproteobacteria bacterium ADurb.BinA280]|nr:MAG: hypothetical protein BWZ07_02944 [Alphaproteobacteria bacterium ADurb.BinA280]